MMSDNNIPTVLDDTLIPDPAGGRIDAGPGLDTVVFLTDSTKATIRTVGTEIVVTYNSATKSSSTVTLQNVERVSFNDRLIAFDDDGNAGKAYRLYEAAFNRTPDQQGLSYWVRYLDKTNDLMAVAQGFVGSAEFQTVYGSTPSNASLVNTFYQNVLDRAGDADGIAHWTGVLSRGVSVATVLAGFSESPENQAAVGPKIANGIFLSNEFFV